MYLLGGINPRYRSSEERPKDAPRTPLFCCYLVVTALVHDLLGFGKISLCGLNLVKQIVLGVHTPGTVFLNHGCNLVGFVEKKSGVGLVGWAQTSNFKKLSHAGNGSGDFFVAFLDRSLPLQSFAVDLFLILIDQAFVEFGRCRVMAPLPSKTV